MMKPTTIIKDVTKGIFSDEDVLDISIQKDTECLHVSVNFVPFPGMEISDYEDEVFAFSDRLDTLLAEKLPNFDSIEVNGFKGLDVGTFQFSFKVVTK